MQENVKAGTRNNQTRVNAYRACKMFDAWRKENGWSNRAVRENPVKAAQAWLDARAASGLAPGTVKTNAHGVSKGLGITMSDLNYATPRPIYSRSRGGSEWSQNARDAHWNQDVVQFQTAVGIRRAELENLRGCDFAKDESGHDCVVVNKGKGGKIQYQVIAPENVDMVRSYFERRGSSELVFGRVDQNLDLHGIRAEHARAEYQRYLDICRTEEGRQSLRDELWARYHDQNHGCKAYRIAEQAEDYKTMQRLDRQFAEEMRDGLYQLRGANRERAIEQDAPTSYDRLALCCVSVFALSHWRNEVTVKYYML